MALNDSAVITPAVGYIYIAPYGTVAPTPAELDALDDFGLDQTAADTPADGADAGTGKATKKSKAALPAAWVNIGHTSRGDLPEWAYKGGDTEIRGTWQNESLREVETKPLADHVKFKLHQFDPDSLELYYGSNKSTTSGVFGVAGGATIAVEKALLIIIVDGEDKIGFHAHKASIKRDEAIKMKTDEFAFLPVMATFLNHQGELKYSWIQKDLLA